MSRKGTIPWNKGKSKGLNVDAKICPKCNKMVSVEYFRKDMMRADFLDGWCVDCRRNNYDPIREKKRKRKFLKKHPDFYSKRWKINKSKYPERIKAQVLANNYFKEPQRCSREGCENIGQKHHPDYSKPLEIVWLCRKHHSEEHRKYKVLPTMGI